MNPLLVAVMGPTASGKSALAESLATELDAVLINADAFQVYRGMDIGTAKPDDRDRYRLLDLKNPDESFGVGEFVRLAHQELQETYAAGRSAIVVGGTGLYVRALFEQYTEMAGEPDPELRASLNQRLAEHGLQPLIDELQTRAPEVAAQTDLKNPVRVTRALERLETPTKAIETCLPPFTHKKLVICPISSQHLPRIEERTLTMVHNGWVREVTELRDRGYGPETPGFRAIGYRAMWGVAEGTTELDEAIATTIAETRRYAKRQRTWLRSEPGLINIDPGEGDMLERSLKILAPVMQ